ncbi:hypothetical protein PF003_g36640 [Phytophthora fragariae]|nr:hypothetical protein PF003_g36640 [Phytophthora fragariae]
MVSAAVTVVAHAASLRTAIGRSCPRVSATVPGVTHAANSEAAGSGRSQMLSVAVKEVAHAASLTAAGGRSRPRVSAAVTGWRTLRV